MRTLRANTLQSGRTDFESGRNSALAGECIFCVWNRLESCEGLVLRLCIVLGH